MSNSKNKFCTFSQVANDLKVDDTLLFVYSLTSFLLYNGQCTLKQIPLVTNIKDKKLNWKQKSFKIESIQVQYLLWEDISHRVSAQFNLMAALVAHVPINIQIGNVALKAPSKKIAAQMSAWIDVM